MKRNNSKPQPAFRLELISPYTHGQNTPAALGLFDTARREVTQIFQLDARSLPGIVPENGSFRLSTYLNEIMSLTTPDGTALDAQDMIAALPRHNASWQPMDTFKNRPGLSITFLRSREKLHKYDASKKLGYALTDDATGEILRYIPESQMRQLLVQMDAEKIRRGRRDNLTSIQLRNGETVQAKQFIDMLVGVERANKPRHVPYAKLAASAVALSGVALIASGMAEAGRISEEFNQASQASYGVQVIPRAPGTDPMASFDAIQNPHLRGMVSNWFLNGAYKDLSDRYARNGMERIETDNPQRMEELRVEAERLEYKMLWPVEVARAVDQMWRQDGQDFRRHDFTSADKLYAHVLATAKIESLFGECMTNGLNRTVLGYYHFNDGTFMDMVQSYKREHGRPAALRGTREDILKLREDPYWATMVLGQYIKATGGDYVEHVMGKGGANTLRRLAASSPDTLVENTSLRGAALDNPSMLGKTAGEVLHMLEHRFDQGLDFVEDEGFAQPKHSAQIPANDRTQLAMAHRDRQSGQTRTARRTKVAARGSFASYGR